MVKETISVSEARRLARVIGELGRRRVGYDYAMILAFRAIEGVEGEIDAEVAIRMMTDSLRDVARGGSYEEKATMEILRYYILSDLRDVEPDYRDAIDGILNRRERIMMFLRLKCLELLRRLAKLT